MVSIKAFHEWIRKNTRPGQMVRVEVRRGEALQTIELNLGVPPAEGHVRPSRHTANAANAEDALTA